MQCPACEHQAPQTEFGNPAKCPSCGVYTQKALKAKLAKQLEAEQAPRPLAAAPQPKKAVGLQMMADHVAVATLGLDGVQPVVVVDVQMRFWSMIVFMVKLWLAAIPAALTFFLILWGIASAIGFGFK